MRKTNRPIIQKRVGSYPYFGVLLNITIALCITGTLGLLLIYTSLLNAKIKENLDVKLFLKKSISQAERLRIDKQLRDLDFIARKKGKLGIRFISKEEAAQLMLAKTGEDFKKLVGNPLPDTYYINIQEKYYGSEGLDDDLKLIRARLESIEGVREVVFEKAYIEEINRNFRKLSYVLASLAFIFLVAAIILIHNAIRLALFSQRFLIRSMQLVGATAMFIKKPFLVRAVVQGLLGGLIAGVFVLVLSDILATWIEELELLQDYVWLSLLFGCLLIFGIIISVLSAWIALNKFLKMSLDELY